MTGHQTWRDLLDRRRNWLDVEAADDFHRDTSFSFARGWFPLIEALLDEIEPVVEATGVKGMLFLTRTDDGGLHIVDSWLPDRDPMDAVRDACDRAAARSRITCEVCGADGRPRHREGYMVIRCDRHAGEGMEDIDGGWN
jgi:hypothetical protein